MPAQLKLFLNQTFQKLILNQLNKFENESIVGTTGYLSSCFFLKNLNNIKV